MPTNSAAQDLLGQFARQKQHQLQDQKGLDIFWPQSILNAFCCEKYKFGEKKEDRVWPYGNIASGFFRDNRSSAGTTSYLIN